MVKQCFHQNVLHVVVKKVRPIINQEVSGLSILFFHQIHHLSLVLH